MRIIKLYEDANKNLTDINAQTASTGEIANAIQNGFEDAGKVISNDDAERLANDAKDLVDEVGAQAVAVVPAEEDFGDEYIVVDNQLTHQLDRCLERARANMRKGNKTNCNLLVEGLPGSGKTAIVES